jgi:hypothetical protein
MSDRTDGPGLHYGRGFAAFGWLLSLGGAAYLVAGLVGLVRGREPAWALAIIGLVALGTGLWIIRWTRRTSDTR